MKYYKTFIISILVISIIQIEQCKTYNILGIFPTSVSSHFAVGHALMKGLVNAGHNVTIISPFEGDTRINSIIIDGIDESMKSVVDSLFDLNDINMIDMFNKLMDMGIKLTNHTLNHNLIKQLMLSNAQFDVIVLEIFLNEAMLGFGYHFNTQIIGLSTFGSAPMIDDLVGSPAPLSYVPNPVVSFTDHMSFVERIGNTLISFIGIVMNKIQYWPKQVAIYESVFIKRHHNGAAASATIPTTLDTLSKNVSLVLLNNHFSINYPRPYVPNMIEVGGLHISHKINTLPNDIRTFLDESVDGAIFFSMGSNLKSNLMPIEKRNIILKVFGKLKQRVLWKWEDDKLEEKPKNVLINKWFPQNDILAHPNVKVFITHGGLLSMSEAIYHGIPLIGIPIFGDQHLNMNKAERSGYGLLIKYHNLTEQSLEWALREILENDKYSKNIKLVSSRYRDQPMSPLATAIYWVEYVARHKGAPHMHCSGQDLHWISYHNLDVYGFLLLILYLFYYTIKLLICKLCCRSSSSSSSSSISSSSSSRKKYNSKNQLDDTFQKKMN